MSIVRAPRPKSGFYILDKKIAEDDRLSWAARGLLIFLLVKPDNWRVSVEHLRKQTESARIATGRDGVYALLLELEQAGYIRREQARDEEGRMAAAEYLVSESPLTAEPYTDEPSTAETTLDKTKRADKNQGISKATRATRLPEDWQPTPDMVQMAEGRGLSGQALEDEIEKFRNYWTSKSRDATKLDWAATFRNWVITATKNNARGYNNGTSHRNEPRQSLVERVYANAQRIIAAERAANGIHDGDLVDAYGADLRAPLDGTARRIP